MGYSQNDLTVEIRKIIEDGLRAEVAMPASWIATSVRSRHPLPGGWSGDDRDFTDLCCWGHVRDQVRKVIQDMKGRETGEAVEAPLPGFELQKAYITKSAKGEHTITPTDKMTAEQLDAKEDEYLVMSRGCLRHAKDLRRFREQRFGPREKAA